MAWQQRLCGENLYHHIYAWGNNRNRIFAHDRHFTYYLGLIALYTKKYQVDVIAYALMDWHVHHFIFDRKNAMPDFIQDLHGAYARYYNREKNRVGHVFGERYHNIVVQPNDYAVQLSRYIHRQAVEARIVRDPKLYRWTSYHRYLGVEALGFLKPDVILDQFKTRTSGSDGIVEYRNYVEGGAPDMVDWEKRNFNVVGDASFCNEVKKMNRENNVKVIPNDLIKMASAHLGVDRENILNPRGRDEKELRHRAFIYLVEEYGCSYNDIARLFKVSRLTVLKTVKTRQNR